MSSLFLGHTGSGRHNRLPLRGPIGYPAGMKPAIELRRTARRGRGVFACRAFKPDDLIEEAPVVLVAEAHRRLLARTALKDYYFNWGNGWIAVAFGLGSFYNHADMPNAEFRCCPATETIRFTAARAIRAGEEIRIDYDCPLWFDAR